MSVAFAIEVTRSAAESRWRALVAAVPAAGLALSALQLAAGPTALLDGPPRARAVVALACALGAAAFLLVALASLRRRAPTGSSGAARTSGASGRASGTRALVVDEAGRPTVREPGEPVPRPMALHAWCTLPGLTLLVLAPYLPQPASGRHPRLATLIVGRDGLDAEGWRRLHVWLRWIERGRLERPTPGPDRP